MITDTVDRSRHAARSRRSQLAARRRDFQV